MKGVKKCFGPLLAFAIMLGLSLSVYLDTSALKHDVQYIPISFDSAVTAGTTNGSNRNPSFEITWLSADAPDENINRGTNHYFTSRLSNNKCTFVNYSDIYTSTPSYTTYPIAQFTYGFDSYRYNYLSESGYPGSSDSIICNQTVPFGTLYSSQSNLDSHPNFDDSSLNNIPPLDRPPYSSLLPYYYDFDSFYAHDTAIDTNTGITYNQTLKLSDIVGHAPNKFNSLTIPLGRPNESVGTITQGRQVKLQGVFDFSGPGNTFTWNSDLSSAYFRLYYAGLTESQSITDTNSNSGGYVDCTTNFISLPANDFYQLEYTCDLISPATFYNGQLWFYLKFYNPYGYLFDTNADWSFGSTFFITDNDDTPGGTWGTAPTGNNLSNAPGSAQALIPSNDDWFSSLSNLFSFGFFNPFAPIFQMFSDNNSCASIPTIAGMIHSEETEVCPWFNSTLRNIVTPVLGLSSMMLVFGFAVRWLGSRSGNFIEDSGGIDSGGYHFENKYRRKN